MTEAGLIDSAPMLERFWLMPEGQQVRLVLRFPGNDYWSTMLRPRYPFLVVHTGGREGFTEQSAGAS